MTHRAVLLSLVVLVLAGCLGPAADVAPADAEPMTLAPGDCLASVKGIDLHAATIPELQAALASGAISSVDLVDAYVARIAAYDDAGPKLNSVQSINPHARAQAGALDAERASGRVRGPLHGIPILLKDNVGTTDLPTTAGSIALAENVPEDNATIATKLVEAGAVLLGKAALSEFAHWMALEAPSGWSSANGQVVNAYTMDGTPESRGPSGSSSGSGVAASMAFAAITIGTETSGSILSPSNRNSVVGVKPTVGLASRAGIIPIAENFDTPGPMGRNVVDAALVLDAIAGPDAADPWTALSGDALPEGGYAAGLATDALAGVRIGYNPDDDAHLAEALEVLEAQGAVLVPFERSEADIVSLTEIGALFNEFKYGINKYLAETAGEGLPVASLDDLVLFYQQNPEHAPYGQDLLIASDATPGLKLVQDLSVVPVYAGSRATADQYFAANDLDAIVGIDAPYTSLGAAAGYPTVTVPAGYDDDMPVGFSFFGPAWSEARLLAYAYAYEQASMRRLPPTAVTSALLEGVCG